MRRIDALVIGGGQAGLAVSRSLTMLGIEHVVVERGRVGERWRSERWDSLTLLTPNWLNRLPGGGHGGGDPDGFMSKDELVDYLQDYATSFSAPIEESTSVVSVVEFAFGGYRVTTDRGVWIASNVVIATGYACTPYIPPAASLLHRGIHQLAPSSYRHPDDLPDGGVLVVGASATGLQLAEEIHGSGRPVTLAVGRHTRVPRTYRGRDIMWWLDRAGILDETPDDVPDVRASRAQPSLQLVGRPDHHTLDLGVLVARGVRLSGKLVAADGHRVHFGRDLGTTMRAADAKLDRLLDRIDDFAVRDAGMTARGWRPRSLGLGPGPESIDLAAEGIRSVLWATGFRRRYPWLRLPIVGADGEIKHRRGVTAAPGVYLLGMPLLTTRRSTYIDGTGRDAAHVASRVAYRVRRGRRPRHERITNVRYADAA